MSQEELPISDSLSLDQSPELREYLKRRFLSVLDLYDIEVSEKRRPVLLYYLQREFVGLGRSDSLLRDPFLEDISCLGPGVPLYVFHRVFGSLRTNVTYDGDIELNKYIFRLAQISGKHISIYQPILDATLRDGSRMNLTLGTEVTRKGSTFSIRKFSQDPVSPIDLLRFGSVSAFEMAYFWTLVENHRSLLISRWNGQWEDHLAQRHLHVHPARGQNRLHRGHARNSRRPPELDPVGGSWRLRHGERHLGGFGYLWGLRARRTESRRERHPLRPAGRCPASAAGIRHRRRSPRYGIVHALPGDLRRPCVDVDDPRGLDQRTFASHRE